MLVGSLVAANIGIALLALVAGGLMFVLGASACLLGGISSPPWCFQWVYGMTLLLFAPSAPAIAATAGHFGRVPWKWRLQVLAIAAGLVEVVWLVIEGKSR